MLNTVILENEAVQAFTECELNGIKIDKIKWLENAKNNEIKKRKALYDLDKVLIETYPKPYFNSGTSKGLIPVQNTQHSLFGDVRLSSVNWDSPKQRLAIFKGLGLPINSTKEDILLMYKDNPVVEKYLTYNSLATLVKKYGKNFLKDLDANGRIHTSYWQILNTGRVSSKDVNLQQIPKTKEFRKCFIAEEGYKLTIYDYSSQELVIIADDSKEEVWIEALSNNIDLHSSIAKMVYAEEWNKATEENCSFYHHNQKCSCKEHKKMRDKIKTFNYAVAYGATKYRIAEVFNILPDEAQEFIDMYFNAMPKLKGYFDSLKKSLRTKWYVRTKAPFRRHRFFSYADYKEDIGGMLREGSNMRIQGSGADQLKLAMVYMWKEKNSNFRFRNVKLLHPTHDEMMCEVPNDIAEEWAQVQKECMLKAARVNCSLGIEVDGGIYNNWAEAK